MVKLSWPFTKKPVPRPEPPQLVRVLASRDIGTAKLWLDDVPYVVRTLIRADKHGYLYEATRR